MGLPIGEALELHVELLDLLRLRSRRCEPFGHGWPFHDPGAVIRAIGVEPHVIGEKRVQTGAYMASATVGVSEQIRAAIGLQAFAPDR